MNYPGITIIYSILSKRFHFNLTSPDFTYLKAQNSSWSMESVLCFRDHVFPRLFPIHTSKPASARMKPRLLLGRLEIQLLASPSRPCCSNTTGLAPAELITFQLCKNVLYLSYYLLMCRSIPVKQSYDQISIKMLDSLIIVAGCLTF